MRRRRRPAAAPPPPRPGLLLALLAALLGHGAVPTELWVCAVVVSATTAATTLFGWAMNRYHRRDATHAAKSMRPGLLYGGYLFLVVCCALGALVVGGAALSAAPRAVQAVLQNWAAIKNVALPFSDPLQIANATADNLHHLAIGLFALATFLWLLLSVSVQLLSRAGVRTLMPPVLCGATLTLSALSLGCAFAYGPTACFASPLGCTGVKAQALSSLMLCLYALARLALGPAASRLRLTLQICGGLALAAAHAAVVGMCWVGADEASAVVGAHWETIRGLLPVGYWGWGCSGDRLPLFAAAAGGAFTTFACLSGGCCLLALLLVFMAHWEWRRYGSRVSQLTYAGAQLSYGGAAAGGSPDGAGAAPATPQTGFSRGAAASVPDSGGVWGGPDGGWVLESAGKRWSYGAEGPGQIWGTPARPGGNHLRHVPHDERRSDDAARRTSLLSNSYNDPLLGNAAVSANASSTTSTITISSTSSISSTSTTTLTAGARRHPSSAHI